MTAEQRGDVAAWLDGETEPGEPFAYPATPGQFAARWNTWSDEQRQRWLDRAVDDASHASHCAAALTDGTPR